ncbi:MULTISPECIES: LysR substrate-binding domain-containing protein [Thalassospira]|uniref:Transcriptional regulator n=2 Tax=Thalassospira TaxID=168934 RepID=A0A367WGN5_9PROT|nr:MULTISPECIES: LysR substrate-binding domain-containing protein [Thalassospira]MDG4718656.1 LysR substrate-binding domain-containing protein [Thalassospira sp. FZY0004]RCK39642.1 transcriptional regulator [Thalassospira profundimaris]
MALRPTTPPLNALRAFEAAARLGSFARAADELAVTPGAISQQVANLEASLGMVLFDRNGPKLSLREAGRAYLPSLRRALDEIEAATLDLVTHGVGERRLVIGALHTLASSWLIPRLKRFQNEYSDIRPVIETLALNFATPERSPDLATRQMDVGLYFGDGSWPGVRADKLFDEIQVVVAKPGTVTVDQRTDLNALIASQTRLIHTTRPKAWHDWGQVNGVPISGAPGPGFEHFFMLIEAAKAGMGIALLPRVLIEGPLAEGSLEVACDATLQNPGAYYLITPQNRIDAPEVTAFRDWLLREVTDNHPA